MMLNRENIKAEMARKSINITEMSKLIGLSRSGFTKKLNGERKFLENEIVLMSKVLDVNPGIFFN